MEEHGTPWILSTVDTPDALLDTETTNYPAEGIEAEGAADDPHDIPSEEAHILPACLNGVQFSQMVNPQAADSADAESSLGCVLSRWKLPNGAPPSELEPPGQMAGLVLNAGASWSPINDMPRKISVEASGYGHYNGHNRALGDSGQPAPGPGPPHRAGPPGVHHEPRLTSLSLAAAPFAPSGRHQDQKGQLQQQQPLPHQQQKQTHRQQQKQRSQNNQQRQQPRKQQQPQLPQPQLPQQQQHRQQHRQQQMQPRKQQQQQQQLQQKQQQRQQQELKQLQKQQQQQDQQQSAQMWQSWLQQMIQQNPSALRQDEPPPLPPMPAERLDTPTAPAPEREELLDEKIGPAEASNVSLSPWGDGQCRWHKSAETVGMISEDGHVFTKTAGPRRSRVSEHGATVELASICMVFDASLRCGGVHRYCYEIMDGELGAADGVGFVFDSKVRRNNIQRMRSVFLNQRGRICLRNNHQVTKLQAQLPPLRVGVCLHLLMDLDSLIARFNVSNAQGVLCGSADVSLQGLFDPSSGALQLRSGFFCAVVTGSITIGLR